MSGSQTEQDTHIFQLCTLEDVIETIRILLSLLIKFKQWLFIMIDSLIKFSFILHSGWLAKKLKVYLAGNIIMLCI